MKDILTKKLIVPIAAAMLIAGCGAPAPTAVPTEPPATAEPAPTTAPEPTLVPTQAPPSAATPAPGAGGDELAQVTSAGALRVGVSADYPPFAFYNQQFRVDGFDPALASDLAKRLGVAIDVNDFAFEGLLAALQLGQVDMAISAISDTPERREQVDFTNAYFIGADGLLGPANAAPVANIRNIAGKRVGAQRGTVYATWLQENLVDRGLSNASDIFLYPDINNGVRDLKEGKIDYLLLDRLPARSFATSQGLTVVAENNVPQRFAMAVRKGSNLRAALNDALLKAQNDGTVPQLIEEFLKIPSDQVEPIPPPAPEPTAAPNPTPVPTPSGPPPCVNGAAYVADLSFDDQNMTAPPVMQPGQGFRKGWRMRNSGNCDWAPSFSMRFVFGNVPGAQMGGQPTAVGQAVAPGATADLFVNLIAPVQPGTYQGFWQMFDAQGTPFGERVWVGITVPAPAPPPAQPTPTPVPGIQFTVSSNSITQGQCVTFSWNVQNVNGVWFYPVGQPWQNYGVPGVGSQEQCPQQTTTYQLRVQFNNGAVQTQDITVFVSPAPNAGLTITQFAATTVQTTSGLCANLNWQVQGNVSNVVLLRNGQQIWSGAPATGYYTDCQSGGGLVTYTLQAFAPNGQSVQATQQVFIQQGGGSSGPTPQP